MPIVGAVAIQICLWKSHAWGKHALGREMRSILETVNRYPPKVLLEQAFSCNEHSANSANEVLFGHSTSTRQWDETVVRASRVEIAANDSTLFMAFFLPVDGRFFMVLVRLI